MSISFRHLRARTGPLLPVVVFLTVGLLILSLFRTLFLIWQWPRVQVVQGLLPVLGYGVRMDVLLLSIVTAVPVLASLLLPGHGLSRAWRDRLNSVWLTLWLTVLVFMELSTPSFISEYDTRPNRLFIEYLDHPKEVFLTLLGEYRLALALSVLLTCLSLWLGSKLFLALTSQAETWPWKRRVILLPLLLLMLFAGARSSFDHRPANPSTAAFSSDHLVNQLCLNSTYSLAYAIYRMKDESKAGDIYGHMDRRELISRLRTEMRLPAASFPTDEIPTLHLQGSAADNSRPSRLPNLVIVLEESLGAQYVESLGGATGLTPELERLSDKGLWLSNLYATGTRSVRGIEAVVAGFPPTPARSVVKLGLSQQNFFTLAQLLKEQGYSTEFIYGGEGHFDNMRGFFLANGFDRVIDQDDYDNPVFRGTWGVSDEDLFTRAHQEFLDHGDKPFFALVFTTSNHSPFEFPDGRIDLATADKRDKRNTVKYADYALGQFFNNAEKAPYWSNTLFLVVADHDSRVYGASLVPIEHFHIPGLILGGTIRPGTIEEVASQIDLAPTLLGLMGIEAEHPMPGLDLLHLPPGFPGRAIMQYGNNHAYMLGEQVVIHQPNQYPAQYVYRQGELQKATVDEALVQNALATALWPSLAYRERTYCLPDPGPSTAVTASKPEPPSALDKQKI